MSSVLTADHKATKPEAKAEGKPEAKAEPKAETLKPKRPGGGWGLLKRLRASGTGAAALEPLLAVFPVDKYGKRTGADVPAKVVLQRMRDMAEEDEQLQAEGTLLIPRLMEQTLEKAEAFMRYGEWTPPVQYEPELEGAFPDEEFDPEEEDEVETPKKKKAKKK